MANFSLVPELRQLVNALVSAPKSKVGDELPISIRKRYPYHQTIVIFPEDGYDFFISDEIVHILNCAKVFNCNVIITTCGDVPVIEITSYNY